MRSHYFCKSKNLVFHISLFYIFCLFYFEFYFIFKGFFSLSEFYKNISLLKKMWSIEKQKHFRKFNKFVIVQLHFGIFPLGISIVLLMWRKKKLNKDFFQISCFKEHKGLASEKNFRVKINF